MCVFRCVVSQMCGFVDAFSFSDVFFFDVFAFLTCGFADVWFR